MVSLEKCKVESNRPVGDFNSNIAQFVLSCSNRDMVHMDRDMEFEIV